jgi:polysaccharide biosynthesis protein PslG
VIPFHAYPETWTPPEVTVERYLGETFHSAFLEPTDAACGKKPVSINETGYATTPGRTEIDQARWWVRAVATFVAAPRIEHIGIYEIKDLPLGSAVIGDAPNYHLGITRVNREKKIAFGTLARLVSMLGGQGMTLSTGRLAVSASPANADVHRHLFTRTDGRQFFFSGHVRERPWSRRSCLADERTSSSTRSTGHPCLRHRSTGEGWRESS